MRPYFFGAALLVGWTLIAAGVLANLAGVDGIGNRPIVLVRPDAPSIDPLEVGIDASVPLAGSASVSVEQNPL